MRKPRTAARLFLAVLRFVGVVGLFLSCPATAVTTPSRDPSEATTREASVVATGAQTGVCNVVLICVVQNSPATMSPSQGVNTPPASPVASPPTLLSLTLICYCHLVGMAKIVRGSTFVRP